MRWGSGRCCSRTTRNVNAVSLAETNGLEQASCRRTCDRPERATVRGVGFVFEFLSTGLGVGMTWTARPKRASRRRHFGRDANLFSWIRRISFRGRAFVLYGDH